MLPRKCYKKNFEKLVVFKGSWLAPTFNRPAGLLRHSSSSRTAMTEISTLATRWIHGRTK